MEEDSNAQATAHAFPVVRFPQNPQVIHTVQHEYSYIPAGSKPAQHSNFLKGVKWSPDGTCLLTASDDGWLRIYDLPQDCFTLAAPTLRPCHIRNTQSQQEQPSTSYTTSQQVATAQHQLQQADDGCEWGGPGLQPWGPSQPDTMGVALRVHEGETVYDYAWFSQMSASDTQSCCFATTTRAHPIHLWDACTGTMRATYKGYNEVDEVTAAYSLAFSQDGCKLFAGYSKWILAFDVSRPGRDSMKIPCSVKAHGCATRLPGIVSCLASSPDGNSLAAGTYGGNLGIFDPRIPEMQLVMQGHKGGLTQVYFTNDSHFVLSGARQDADLCCWDLRSGYEGGLLYRMTRDTQSTNQRIGFSLDTYGRYVATGGCDGCVKVFDLQTGQQVDTLPVAEDTVNGCDFHPFLNLLALGTGHRRYPISMKEDEEDGQDEEADNTTAASTGKPSTHATSANGICNALRILRLETQDGLQ